MLGRHDCGALTVGRRADLAVWDVAMAANTGAWDPVDGLVLCPPAGVRDLVVEGRTIISGGELRSAPLPAILDQARHSIARLRDR
jgi:cytosine/adenosine deaminase-related metal-dependent hydrolase